MMLLVCIAAVQVLLIFTGICSSLSSDTECTCVCSMQVAANRLTVLETDDCGKYEVPSGSSEEIFRQLYRMVTCSEMIPCIQVSNQVLEAFERCIKDEKLNSSCLLPCMMNNLGFASSGKYTLRPISDFLKHQFASVMSMNISSWTDGIKKCLERYESDYLQTWPTDYSNCSSQLPSLIALSKCIFAATVWSKRCPVIVPNPGESHPTPHYFQDIINTFFPESRLAYEKMRRTVINPRKPSCGVAGCHKGYCWSYCASSKTYGPWCYTGFNSILADTCRNHEDCDRCSNCTTICSTVRQRIEVIKS